jgi:hypothetical protein
MVKYERKYQRMTRTAKEKLKAILYLSSHTLKETTEKFCCDKSMLSRWKRRKQALQEIAENDSKNKNLSGGEDQFKTLKLNKLHY